MCFSLPSMTAVKSQNYFSKKFTTGVSGMCVNVLPDGYLMTCAFQGSSTWMIKTDLEGNETQRRLYSNFSCSHPDLTLLDKDRVFIGGIANVNDSAGLCLVRLNTNGDTLWTRKYRKTGCQEVSCGIVKSHDGNLVIAVKRWNFASRQRDLLVYKLDTAGNMLSEKVLFGIRNLTDWTSIRYANNEYYFSYYYAFERDHSDIDGALMKTDTNFIITYHKPMGPKGDFADYNEVAYFVPMQNKQSAFIWKQDSTSGAWQPYIGQTNTAIFNLDSVGEKKATHFFYDRGLPDCPRTAESVRVMKNGDIVGVGKLSGICTDGNFKGWIFRMSPTGRLKWERFITDSLYYPPQPYLWLIDFKETPSSDLIISGLILKDNPQFNPILIKVDSNGCLFNRRCDSADIKVSVNSFSFEQQNIKVFPNPVSHQLNIDYVPENGNETLEISVFDILGKTVFSRKFDAFRDPLSINVSNLAEGMYIISVSVQGKKTYISKFIKR